MATVLSLFLLKALTDLTNGRKEPKFSLTADFELVFYSAVVGVPLTPVVVVGATEETDGTVSVLLGTSAE